jgi:hypothetical protein
LTLPGRIKKINYRTTAKILISLQKGLESQYLKVKLGVVEAFMNKKYVNLMVQSFLGLCVFINMQPFHGTFKHQRLSKPLIISMQTKTFLKNSVALQQKISCCSDLQELLELKKRVMHVGQVAPKNVETLFDLIVQSQKLLFCQGCLFASCKSDQAWKHWWQFLKQSLEDVVVRGYEKDLKWLKAQIATLETMLNFKTEPTVRAAQVVRCVQICSELMRHFDGVMVTDYDLFVLGDLVFALVVLQC